MKTEELIVIFIALALIVYTLVQAYLLFNCNNNTFDNNDDEILRDDEKTTYHE